MATTDRVHVRLGREHWDRLTELSQERGVTVSTTMRNLIDQAYEESVRQRRARAARRLCELEVEDVPDPDVLNRQLDSTHDLGSLY